MDGKHSVLLYSDKMGGEFKNGVWTVECNSWPEFDSRVKEFKKSNKYVWRGQSCDKELLPTIYRDDKRPDHEKIKEHLDRFKKEMPWAADLQKLLEDAGKPGTPFSKDFDDALRDYYKMIHPKEDADDPKENYAPNFSNYIFWAIGRHQGLATPLLDWTREPYKALFFALCQGGKKDKKRVVFGLDEKSRRLVEKKKQPIQRYIEFPDNPRFVLTMLDMLVSSAIKESITRLFDRITKQEGRFTRTLYNEDIENHVKKCYRYFMKKDPKDKIIFLIKILIPNCVRKRFLRNLEDREITYKKMFPDLQGEVWHCNLKLELSQ